MNPYIADLHCDLLSYLEGHFSRTPFDDASRCSIPQLQSGNVKIQTLAAFTETERGSSVKGSRQAEIFSHLPHQYPAYFETLQTGSQLKNLNERILILFAIENASGFFEEGEPFDQGMQRLQSVFKNCGKIAYISLTWNTENRFGGGAHTTIGLKEDGKRLIDWLGLNNIAIDLSHASDILSYEILDYMSLKNFNIPLIASHSNYRSVTSVPRNLPEGLAKEILNRNGLIGFNFFREFIGTSDESNFVKQLEYSLSLGGSHHICFGADFFFAEDLPKRYHKPKEKQFFPGYGDASSYGKLLKLWKDTLKLSDQLLDQIAHGNLIRFLLKNLFIVP